MSGDPRLPSPKGTSVMLVRGRLLKPAEAHILATWLLRYLPIALPIATLISILTEAIAQAEIKGLIIEELCTLTGATLPRAVGLSGFLAAGLFNSCVAAAKPFFVARLLEQVTQGPTPFLGFRQIAKDNSGDGLHLVVEYIQEQWDLSAPLWREVLTVGHNEYIRHHKGYNLRGALQEYWTVHSEVYSAAGYKVVREFEMDDEALKTVPVAFGRSRSLSFTDGKGPPGLTVTNAFGYNHPRCRFTATEQRVLLKALEKLTDDEVAYELSVTANAVKQAWRSIYERVEMTAPFVFAQKTHDNPRQRGPEKRRYVLNFVEAHPEELRPYLWV